MAASDPAVEAARAYEELHVGALFRQWTRPVLDAARVGEGHEVLDVACGTGVLAREARPRVGPRGTVTGLDLGAGMLAVAAELDPDIRWVEGAAGDLPFADDTFDAVVCQFGLMFFPDRVGAVREMLRVARPGGRVVLAVWESLERSQAYPEAVDLLLRRAGPVAADALRAPFVLGDPDELLGVFAEAGAPDAQVETLSGTARFPSIRSMVEADLRGWLPVMGVDLEEDLVRSILAEAETVLGRYVTGDGEMVFDAPAHLVSLDVG
ncbi:methyltransferase domain-containing protein [uncultured Phycicoccus sp.]|uniref:methyltransferase domain-containing protein n=1 Tax=uncultured Phycicoccus sp. TaxID=661422 RepID=UPI0026159D7E|nr:methyltransferase domain-containing protein [uncultured Phycicoccus sp.]